MRNRLRKIATVLATIYLGVLVLLMLLETTLLYPAPPSTRGDWQADWLDHEDVYFTSSDGTSLHGWYCPKVNHGRILFCHGNGEDVSNLADELDFLRRTYQANVFAFDYRGYGHSQGRPKEPASWPTAKRRSVGWPSEQAESLGRSFCGDARSAVPSPYIWPPNTGQPRDWYSTALSVPWSMWPPAIIRGFPIRSFVRNRYPSIDKLPADSRPPSFNSMVSPTKSSPIVLPRRYLPLVAPRTNNSLHRKALPTTIPGPMSITNAYKTFYAMR